MGFLSAPRSNCTPPSWPACRSLPEPRCHRCPSPQTLAGPSPPRASRTTRGPPAPSLKSRYASCSPATRVVLDPDPAGHVGSLNQASRLSAAQCCSAILPSTVGRLSICFTFIGLSLSLFLSLSLGLSLSFFLFLFCLSLYLSLFFSVSLCLFLCFAPSRPELCGQGCYGYGCSQTAISGTHGVRSQRTTDLFFCCLFTLSC